MTKFKVGDNIGFKDDIENYGRIISIRGNVLIVSVYDSITGEENNVSINANRAWLD